MLNPESDNGAVAEAWSDFAKDPQRWREYCARCSRQQLADAVALIPESNEPMRAIVLQEIDHRNLTDAELAADTRHLERNFSSKLTHRLAILLTVIAVIALGIAVMEWAGVGRH